MVELVILNNKAHALMEQVCQESVHTHISLQEHQYSKEAKSVACLSDLNNEHVIQCNSTPSVVDICT
jgi:hypothetical protein